jgi:superfamily I DNA/RNA helicase
MEYTHEQKLAISAVDEIEDNDIIKIKAFAGCGKSTTLKAIADEYPQMRFLYLVFNKSMQMDADKKFPENVEVRTVHSLALKHVSDDLKLRMRPPVNGSIQIKDLQEHLRLKDYKQTLCIRSLFTAYCYSAYPDLSKDTVTKLLLEDELIKYDCLECGLKYDTAHLYLRKIWIGIEKGELPITHDFYLKFFQLNIDNYTNLLSYDAVLLDEAHDSNMVTLAVFLACSGKKILVADPRQKIYGWRKAVNILDLVDAKKELYLTTTFRFDSTIADKANHVLNVMLGEKEKIKPFVN